MKHIYLDKFFLIFLLFIILTGNFNGFFPYFMLLLIHEFGHALCGVILGYKLNRISFYPYGGITSFNLPINIPLKEELLILIMGPLFQVMGYLILQNFYFDIRIYHYTLLIFNLLPIYPLDGGKIFNILCGYVYNYLKSFYITFIFSIFLLFILFLYNLKNFNLNLLLMIIIMLQKLIESFNKRYYYYNRFLLERYLYKYSFKKIKIVDNVKSFYRDRRHYVKYEDEKSFLKKYFH